MGSFLSEKKKQNNEEFFQIMKKLLREAVGVMSKLLNRMDEQKK